MHFNYLALAVPLFLILMWLEYAIGKKRRIAIHHFDESVANINVGIAERLADLFVSSLFFYF